MSLFWSGTVLDWAVGAAMATIVWLFVSYRVLTRGFGFGPRDV
jgi:hypothetical protein